MNRPRTSSNTNVLRVLLSLTAVFAVAPASASSHREAPFVTQLPKVDGTDFYMFVSYEPGRSDFVTLVANYLPLQDPYGGPNYFTLDPAARYEIHIDNDADALPDLTFRFEFEQELKGLQVPVGDEMVAVPLINIGAIGPMAGDNAALNVVERFRITLVPENGPNVPIVNADTGEEVFVKPVDNIGNKSIPSYASYAADHVYNIDIPGSSIPGRAFVGQRKDPFVVNLGETFDLVNFNPLGLEDAETDDLQYKNVTSLILEIPIAALLASGEPAPQAAAGQLSRAKAAASGSEAAPSSGQVGSPIIGGWTTASLPRARVLTSNPTFDKPATQNGSYVQVSRLAMPLVNEVVIGLPDKDKFNASKPGSDGQFFTYVTNPSLPVLLNVLFGVTPPCLPRNDLVAVFLTGVAGLNQPPNVTPSEMIRLNTSIPPTSSDMQSRLGVLGGDLAGFPNGRRPGDDIVDIELRVVMGALYPDAGDPQGCAPFGNLPFTDGAFLDAGLLDNAFPYLRDPVPGSPN